VTPPCPLPGTASRRSTGRAAGDRRADSPQSIRIAVVTVLVAAAMAVLAATLFAIAAVAQNGAVATVVQSPDPTAGPILGAGELRALMRSRTWLVGTSLTAIASLVGRRTTQPSADARRETP
jgi:hypothetical protein